MHWAEVFADTLLQKQKNHVLATGITPSGPIHIGNMREILTTDAVFRCLVEKGGDAELIYVADDFDPLRRVYPYLSKEQYEQHVGRPICDIPCPCGNHKSYADHFLSSFLQALKEIGVTPKVYRASEMYRNGEYAESIHVALENTKNIGHIIETISKRELPKNWLPFNVCCENCKKLSTTTPISYEYPMIEYNCTCGHHGTIDIRKGGVGKLPWRVDWPARWKMLGVTFEPCGKDLATVGGARDTGAQIVEQIYKYPHPALLVYEFILLKGKGAMHSSQGTALSAEEMLHMTPPEVLRFLITNNQPQKHLVFDSGLGLLNLVDEYDTEERTYFGKEEQIKGMKDLKKTYELSQPYKIPKTLPHQVPYRHLVTLVQIGKTWDDIKDVLQRTKQIPKKLTKEDEHRLMQRADHARYWLVHFAPDIVKFELQPNLPNIQLSEEQQQFLSKLKDILPDVLWEAEEIHKAIYQISEQQKIPVKTAFATLYKILLGQENGPRAGYFLSTLEKPFVLNRVTEALK